MKVKMNVNLLIPKWIIITVGIVIVLGINAGGAWYGYKYVYEARYEKGFNAGHSEGHSEGYSEGYSEGQSAGFATGKREGYADGLSVGTSKGIQEGREEGVISGQAEGYTMGYDVGYEEGVLQNITKWIDQGYDQGWNAHIADVEATLAAQAIQPTLTSSESVTLLNVYMTVNYINTHWTARCWQRSDWSPIYDNQSGYWLIAVSPAPYAECNRPKKLTFQVHDQSQTVSLYNGN